MPLPLSSGLARHKYGKGAKLHALVLTDDNSAPLHYTTNHPEPTPSSSEVLIRVDLAGICATDLELARGYMGFQGVPGHEFVGTVIEGPADLLNTRVVGEINYPCGTCPTCRAGHGNHCPTRTVLGIAGRDGALAEFLTLPTANCHPVPDSFSNEQAVFAEPLAAAVHVLDAANINANTRVTLLGTGRLGLLTAQVLATTGCHPRVVGRNPITLRWCADHGLDATPVDQLTIAADRDVVVDCTGTPDGLRLALQLCRPLGTLVLKSTYADPAPLDLAPIVIHEINVVGNRCGDFAPALDLLAAGRINTADLISATYPLADGVAAFDAAQQPDNIKVLLDPHAS